MRAAVAALRSSDCFSEGGGVPLRSTGIRSGEEAVTGGGVDDGYGAGVEAPWGITMPDWQDSPGSVWSRTSCLARALTEYGEWFTERSLDAAGDTKALELRCAREWDGLDLEAIQIKLYEAQAALRLLIGEEA
jgi:hypothetical protein